MTVQDQTAADGEKGVLELAIERLDRALTTLDSRLVQALARRGGEEAFAGDRSRLAVELDASKARERMLEQLAAEASAALGRAADEVRAALNAERNAPVAEPAEE